MKELTKYKKGIFFAFCTAIVSGISIFYSKLSVAKIDPLAMATFRNLFVGTLFLILLLGFKGYKRIQKLNYRQFIWLVVLGLVGGGIPFFLFFSGIKLVGAQTANIIHKSLFVWVLLFSSIFLKEKIRIISIVGSLLIVAGIYLFTPLKLVFGRGEQLILLATFLWAVENIIAKKVLRDTTPDIVGFFRMGIGGLMLFMITVYSGKGTMLIHMSLDQYKTLIVGGGLLFFYVTLWYRALQFAPAGLVTMILTFSIVVGTLLTGGVLQEGITKPDLYTLFFILTGVFIAVFARPLLDYLWRFNAGHGR